MITFNLIQNILKNHFRDYLETHRLPVRVINAIKSQIRCRTPDQGVSHYICAEDGEQKEINHSCRNKGCTVCNEKRQVKWLEKQQEKLLNCDHYHIVFTLPQEYHPLWLYNRDWFIKAQFEASAETLKDLLEGNNYKGKDYKGRLNACAGFISTLHTWGRSMNLHPHIHILISAGGLDKEGNWKDTEDDYLLPIKQVKALYRGKLQHKIKHFIDSNTIKLPKNQSKQELQALHTRLYKKEWSVRIQEKYSHGKGVLVYLSRYLGASPIKPEQIKLIHHGKAIEFTYWSHREKKKIKQQMSINAFIDKYCLHQSRSSAHTTRYYGLYAAQSKRKRARCVEQLGKTEYQQKQTRLNDLTPAIHEVLCSCCGVVMQLAYVTYCNWTLKNPLYREGTSKLCNTITETEPIGVIIPA